MDRVINWIGDYADDDRTNVRKCTVIAETKYGKLSALKLYTQETDGPTIEIFRATYKAGPLMTYNGLFHVWDTSSGHRSFAGCIKTPGWFSSQTLIQNETETPAGGIIYKATSRDGKLMDMEVVLPKLVTESKENIKHLMLQDALRFPEDLITLISLFVGESTWSPSVRELTLDNMKFKKRPEKLRDSMITLRNKKPVWNPAISAYTLEFHGRAQLPSVHNFQLVEEPHTKQVILQLGKVSASRFNMDYAYPLTTFQAFSVCISVIQRTFVHD